LFDVAQFLSLGVEKTFPQRIWFEPQTAAVITPVVWIGPHVELLRYDRERVAYYLGTLFPQFQSFGMRRKATVSACSVRAWAYTQLS